MHLYSERSDVHMKLNDFPSSKRDLDLCRDLMKFQRPDLYAQYLKYSEEKRKKMEEEDGDDDEGGEEVLA